MTQVPNRITFLLESGISTTFSPSSLRCCSSSYIVLSTTTSSIALRVGLRCAGLIYKDIQKQKTSTLQRPAAGSPAASARKNLPQILFSEDVLYK